jgi:hypothetical protein
MLCSTSSKVQSENRASLCWIGVRECMVSTQVLVLRGIPRAHGVSSTKICHQGPVLVLICGLLDGTSVFMHYLCWPVLKYSSWFGRKTTQWLGLTKNLYKNWSAYHGRVICLRSITQMILISTVEGVVKASLWWSLWPSGNHGQSTASSASKISIA